LNGVNDIWRRTHRLDREIMRQTDESSATAADVILPWLRMGGGAA
jgi:hypothetical protein